MSDSGGTDNPAFSNADEYTETSAKLENSHSDTYQQEQKDKSSHMSNGHSFVSQHIDSTQNTPQAEYKTETRIDVPTEGDKTSNTVKTNGINGNGNKHDLSFLNTSITSGQISDGKKEQIEAVNLELVSMRPYTGNNLQTKGQEACEIPSDPYEEYFVPVNEHRKYIRGEKLYVTKDKRSKSSYWRRIACWSFGLSVLVLALIIAILAATGVILSQEATQPLDNEHQRSLDDVNAAGSREFIKNPPSSPPPEMSTFPPWRTTDETILKTVPNAVEGSIWLDNLTWNDDLMNSKTRVYRNIADEIENSLMTMIHADKKITIIRVYNITRTGQVMFRIAHPPSPDPEDLEKTIEKMLRENENMIGKYHLNSMNIKNLIDECSYEEMNCSDICKFDYNYGIFTCACLSERILDATGIHCIEENDLSDVKITAEEPRSSIDDIVQGRGRSPEQSFESNDHGHWTNHHHHYDDKEITIRPSKSEMDGTTSTTLLLNQESTSELVPHIHLNPQFGADPESKLESESVSEHSVSSSEPSKTGIIISEGTSESTSDPKFESEFELKSSTEMELNLEPNPKFNSAAESNIEPISELETVSQPTIKLTSEPELALELNNPISEPESITKPKSEPDVVLEITTETVFEQGSTSEVDIGNNTESTSVFESNSEQNSSPQPVSEVIAPESVPEVIEEPRESKIEENSVPELITEPTFEPKIPSESTSERASELETTTESNMDTNFGVKLELTPIMEANLTSVSNMSSYSEVKQLLESSTEYKFEYETASTFHPLHSPDDGNNTMLNSESHAMSTHNENINSTPETTLRSNASMELEVTPFVLEESVYDTVQTTIASVTELTTESISLHELNIVPVPTLNYVTIPRTESTLESTLNLESEIEHNLDSILTPTVMDKTTLMYDDIEPATELNTKSDISSESTEESKSELDNTENPEAVKDNAEVLSNTKLQSDNFSPVGESITIEPETVVDVSSTIMPLPVIAISTEQNIEELSNTASNTVNITTNGPNISVNVSTLITTSNNQSHTQDLNLVNIIDAEDDFNSSKVESIENVQSSNDEKINSLNSTIQNMNTLPHVIPEKIDPYVLIRNAFRTSTEKIEDTTDSTSPEIQPSLEDTSEKTSESHIITDEKHQEDMSPFLPVIVREKETFKKAPRLDKDEQDFPNPFEPHVEDVITHHKITMTLPSDVNGNEFIDTTNKLHLSHDVQQTETGHHENVNITETTIVTTLPLLTTQASIVTEFDDAEEKKLDMKYIDDLIANATDSTLTNTDIPMNNSSNASTQYENPEPLEPTVTDSMNTEKTSDIEKNIAVTTSPSTMIVKSITAPAIHSIDSKLVHKFDDNTDEDLYNDIIEERISKKIENNDSDLRKKNYLSNKSDIKTTTISSFEVSSIVDEIESTTIISENLETAKMLTPEMTTQTLLDDNKLTTEIPIMPIEIQQDISTTEIIEKPEPTVINNLTTIIIDSPKTIPSMSMMEEKTTAQIPILSEEFLTTEASTTEKMSTLNENGMPTTRIAETSTVSFEHIKPVSELIIDDATPEFFDHTQFFKTSQAQPVETQDYESISEDKLKIIPLDFDTIPSDQAFINTTEIPVTMQTIFNLSDVTSTTPKDISSVSKLKIIEITSASDQLQKDDRNVTFNATAKSHSTPEIIPVYEEIEEDIENPMINPPSRNNIFQLLNISKTLNDNEKNVTRIAVENITITPIIISNDNLKIFSKCNAGQFECVNGTSRDGAYCVSLSSKCNSENDCSDGSDETNCEIDGCPGNFQCKSGQCLGRHLVCNSISDCDDGSDEYNCQDWTCHFDEFKCPSGRCIPDLWRCNGRPDCEDHRDEYSCSKSCGNDEYLCPTENWCVPQTWRCNGIKECANGEDEKLCDCGIDQFKCETGGCIASHQVCDGVNHCPDRSDEWECLMENKKSMKNNTEDENETLSPVGQSVLLRIKLFDGDRHLVCADNWTKNHSDNYCRSLGYFGSDIFEAVENDENEQNMLHLKQDYQDTIGLVGNLELTDTCNSKKFVKISCQEFSCGSWENEGPTARLIGGTPAGDGQWSSVALLKEIKSGVACTASILGPLHALASYSCIHTHRQSSNWKIFTGRELKKSVKVNNIIPYPQVKYNQFLYNNDVALIELADPLILSRNLSAICLPRQQFQPRALCVTAGWGFPTNGEVNLKLKFLPVPIYNTEECNATSHYAGFITNSNVCAGFTGTDKGTCYNDEGAPLICASETGRWELQGLLSHHSRCSRDHPAIYSSLSPIIPWLQHSIPALQNQT